MRLPNTAHTSQPWRIHEVTADFRVEDVWGIEAPGGPGAFERAVRMFAAFDPAQASSPTVRALFATRWMIGGLLGWDTPAAAAGARVPTLRDRLPDDLRRGERGPRFETLPFESLYLTETEWAAEIANATMHGVLHVGLVTLPGGGSRAQMALLVKPNGPFGYAYMAAIRPFRHLIVYPQLTRDMERRWRRAAAAPAAV